MLVLALLLSIIVGYLLGSLNISIIIGKIKKDDIRNHGSGNAGATNSLRTFGKKVAALVVIGDFLKGVIAILLAKLFAHLFGVLGLDAKLCIYAAGLFVVLGHNFPIFFGFKGGKGIITSVAVIFMVEALAGAFILVCGILVIIFTRYVSLGSSVGALAFPLYVIVTNFGNKSVDAYSYIAFSIVLCALALIRHSGNFKRLIKGTERKLGQKEK